MKNKFKHIDRHTPNRYSEGEGRVQNHFLPEVRTETRTTHPHSTNKLVDFRRTFPITYPTGIGVIPQLINLPVVPDPIPNKTPAKFQDKLYHVRNKVGNKLSLDKLLQVPISHKIWFPSTKNELG